MAPEQGSDPRDADARADLYSLGCTLYFFLAGMPPFGDRPNRTLLQKVMAHAKEDGCAYRPDSGRCAWSIDGHPEKDVGQEPC